MIYLVVPPPKDHQMGTHISKSNDRISINMPYDKSLETLQTAKGYMEYVKHHGYHFTDKLADYVSASFINADGEDHVWTSSHIQAIRKEKGLPLKGTFTNGDFTYLANMYYSDFTPSEEQCIEMAKAIMMDPDGYEGMVFLRWTADVMGKHLDIPWKNFY